MLFDFEVRVEVEDNLLVGLRSIDDPLAVLVGGVVIGVAWGGDVPSVLGVQAAPTRLSCADTEGNEALKTALGHWLQTASPLWAMAGSGLTKAALQASDASGVTSCCTSVPATEHIVGLLLGILCCAM